ncbi:MAG TPA: T9SS type A sorting domain-containing protein, partial [Flavobacteriales bacterium]|nr:T9SS type A sorting domain-containing protein [Flavobacteriales bacterium]
WSNALYFIDADEWIDYTIRFQNTGTDTAFNVVITDTIGPELDLGTFEAGAASHSHSLAIRDGNVLRWAFYNIQLPDSNVNEPRSHGFVSFRIKPRLPLAPTTSIENIANIYFDFNPPVITEPSVLVAEFSTSSNESQGYELLLAPNPVAEQLFVRNLTGKMAGGEMRVIGPDGRMITSVRITDERMALDLSQLAAGHYVLQVRGADQRMHHEKFIICR